MRILNLITDPTVSPYTQQVAALEAIGVEQTTVSVGRSRSDDSRSITDYLRFVGTALREWDGDYDLVHANYGLIAPVALALPGMPVVVSLWGSDLMGRYGVVSDVSARFADATIVMSQQMADQLSTDCYVIPHGVDLSLFEPMEQRDAREQVGWTQDGYHVLFPYAPVRNVKDFPRAQRVVDRATQRLESPVTLQTLDYVPHERVPVYMNAADAMLLTSRREGSPNTVKEALAVNLPIVATDVGDVRERLAGVHPSHVCTSDDALVDGLVDVLERGEPSNGRDIVEPLGLEQMSRRILAVYESVV